MSRVKLTPLDAYRFSFLTSIRITDLNYGAHLGNDAVVTLMHEARARMLESIACSEQDLGDGATGFVQADLVVNYLQEGFAFEEIDIQVDVTDLGSTNFRVYYRFLKNDTPMIIAETGMVCFDFSSRKVRKLPAVFVERLASLGV